MKRPLPNSTMIALLAFALGILPVCAKHSDEFLLGAYSHLRNNRQVNYPDREAICANLQELGYNSTIIETAVDDPDLSGLLNELDRRGIDAWIMDRRWFHDSPADYTYSIIPVSTSNYLRLEAEFASEADVKNGDALDSRFWYAARSDALIKRVGRAKAVAEASYGYVWQAEWRKDTPGFVFSDLRYRWPNVNGAYVRLGREFNLYQTNPPHYEGNYLWINYRFRISGLKSGLDPQEPLLTFSVAGYQLSGKGFASQALTLGHARKEKETKFPQTVYRARDYLESRSGDGFIDLQLKVAYSDLLEANLLTADLDNNPDTAPSVEALNLVNINPRIHWHGNCDLQVDYVEIEDQIHHELVSNQELWHSKVAERMRKLISTGPGNVSGFYTFDEPRQGQFDSYRIVQDIARKAGSRVFTATYDYQADNYVLPGHAEFFYDHIDGFRKAAEPLVLANDIYPITPDVRWDLTTGKSKGRFIQDELDDKLLQVYREGKKYCLEDPERALYPIVQVFGRWLRSGGKEQWIKWLRPPAATQKSLLYLPLCFGADGIIHYRLRVFQSRDTYGDRAMLYSRQGEKNYPVPVEDPVTWPAVRSSNPRVKEYGKIIRGLTWLESESIGTAAGRTSNWQKQTMLDALHVRQSGKGEYEGYVQCGYFQDADGLPYYMVVNRRGNYFVPDAITEPRFVPDAEYEKYFPEAGPQVLRLTFSSAATRKFGKNLVLHDPYDEVYYPVNGKSAEISLPAGEGRLLQLLGTLPGQTKGRHKLKGTTVLSEDVTLQKRAKVIMDKGSHLILMPGTKLTVSSKSKLHLKGKVTLLGDAQIIVRGTLKDESVHKELASGAAIVR